MVRCCASLCVLRHKHFVLLNGTYLREHVVRQRLINEGKLLRLRLLLLSEPLLVKIELLLQLLSVFEQFSLCHALEDGSAVEVLFKLTVAALLCVPCCRVHIRVAALNRRRGLGHGLLAPIRYRSCNFLDFVS